jgi:hypothetical protein
MFSRFQGMRSLILAVTLVALPSAAVAATSGSFTITVIIPPFAAGIEATKAGAVGLSTLDQPGGGLLVSTPDQVAQGAKGTVDVFSRDGTSVTLRVADGGPSGAPSNLASVDQGEAVPFNGMTRTSFTVVPATPVAPAASAAPAASPAPVAPAESAAAVVLAASAAQAAPTADTAAIQPAQVISVVVASL